MPQIGTQTVSNVEVAGVRSSAGPIKDYDGCFDGITGGRAQSLKKKIKDEEGACLG